MTSDLMIIILKVGMLKGVPIFNGMYLRRTGYFLPGGGGGRTVEQRRGPMQQHRPYWHMKMAPYSFSRSMPANFEHKLRRHKQTFRKIPPTVVLDKDENLL